MTSGYQSSIEIESLDYSKFVSLINERNRCSGGIRTIQEATLQSRLTEKSKVLEIGSNTGFTSVNIGLLVNCNVVGIDINNCSIKNARDLAKKNGLENKVRFKQQDAIHLGFPDQHFDMVWASNVTSFIEDKEKSIREYLRVLKTNGTLCIVPIYYKKTPPIKLVDKVSQAINARLEVFYKDDWKSLFERTSRKFGFNTVLYYEKDFCYIDVSDKIEEFIQKTLESPNIKKMSKITIRAIENRARYFYNLFNENLKYCGFSILLYQKRLDHDESELFLTKDS